MADNEVQKSIQQVTQRLVSQVPKPATTDPISLTGLEAALRKLDAHFEDELRLEHVSFGTSFNHSLGFGGASPDFTAFAPWKAWSEKDGTIKLIDQANKIEEDAIKSKQDLEKAKQDKNKALQANLYPTALQGAVLDALKAAKENAAGVKSPFIDFASLKPDYDGWFKFFLESGKDLPSIADALADFVNSFPDDSEPVIRYLNGDERGSTPKDVWNDHEKCFRAIFFGPGKDGKPRFRHPKAQLYVGYYCPNFKTGSKDLAQPFIDLVEKNVVVMSVPGVQDFVKNLHPERLVNHIQEAGLPVISWNHGKILAINGKVMMTGGQNFWDAYSCQGDHGGHHNIVDHQVKVVGDATISAHKWADYFWKYLNKLTAGDTPTGTDQKSFWRSTPLNSLEPQWTENGKAVGGKSVDLKAPEKNPFAFTIEEGAGAIKVLTTSKLGDWYGPMKNIEYPIQIIDALRDIVMNLCWQWSADKPWLLEWPYDMRGSLIWALNKALSDDNLYGLVFKDNKINPLAWASRTAKTQAIANAKSSVIISQQMLVDSLPMDNGDYRTLVNGDKANNKIGLNEQYEFKKEPWDGFTWPFDFLIAIAQALGASIRSKNPSKWTGIFIVLTTKVSGQRGGWEDRTSIARFKRRLRKIMGGLPQGAGDVTWAEIDKALATKLHIRRIEKDDGTMWCHSKIVCVDEKIMYVGSDNIYPSYNEEHGIWMEDPKTIKSWIDGYWNTLWEEHSTEPKNEDTADFGPFAGKN